MPLMDLFWSMLWFFMFIIWIWLLITIFADIFRSHDMGGWGKALWTLFVIIVPFLGVLIYLIARGHSMQDRAVQAAAAHEKATQEYIRQVSSPGSNADELAKLAALKEKGVLTNEEFEAQKAVLLGTS